MRLLTLSTILFFLDDIGRWDRADGINVHLQVDACISCHFIDYFHRSGNGTDFSVNGTKSDTQTRTDRKKFDISEI